MNRRLLIGYSLFIPGAVLTIAAVLGAFGDPALRPSPVFVPTLLMIAGYGFFRWSERRA